MKTAIIIITSLVILLWIAVKLMTSYIANDSHQRLMLHYGGATKLSVAAGLCRILELLLIGADIILVICLIL